MQRYYFPIVTLLLLLFTLVGFSDNLFTNTGQPSNSDPKFIVHGLLCGAWMLLLFVQANLVRVRNMRLHQSLGITGFLIAVGVTLSTIWVFIMVWKGWAAMSPEVKANRILLPSYSVFVALAYLQRRRSDWHKRLILAGTFFMMEPVLARCYDPAVVPMMVGWSETQIEAAFLPWLFTLWTGLFLSLLLYDWATMKRFHPVSLFALFWFGLTWFTVTSV
ncbi:MAG: hypothetical protein C0429_14055 [Sphingopyxis sp.]|nr:hypothetical protein [Sphingopyxis sp.]